MAVEIQDLIAFLATTAVAWVDSTLDAARGLYSAGMPNTLGVGALAAGGIAGGVAASGAAGGGAGRGDRGFRYTGTGDNTIRDSPSSDGTVVGTAPAGGRLVYDQVVRDANGTPTHYHVNPPGGRPGYIPAGSTSETRPTPRPPARPSVVIDSGAGLANASAAQTAGSRG